MAGDRRHFGARRENADQIERVGGGNLNLLGHFRLALESAQEVTRLLPLVRQLYQTQVRDDPASGPADAEFVADAEARRLIVTARPAQLERIDSILAGLRAQAAGGEREIAILELKVGEASNVAPLVTRLLGDVMRDRRGPAYEPRASIVPDRITFS